MEKRPLRAILRMARPQRRQMVLGLVLAIVTALAGIGLLVLSGWFIAASAVAGATTATALAFNFTSPSAGIRGFAVLRTGSRYAERLVTHDATFRFLAGLRVWLFRAAIPLAPARLEEQRGGDLLNRMTADVDSLDAIYLRVIVPSIVAGIAVLLVGGVLLWLAPAAAAIVVVLALLVGIALPLAMRRIGAAPGQAIAAATARLRTRIVEGVQGLAELKVYQADGRHAEAVLGDNETLMAAQRRMARLSGISTALSGLAGQLAALAILALGVAGVAAGVLPGPAVALMMLGALALFDALVPLPLAFQNLGRTRAAARRLLDFAALEPLVRDPATPAAAPVGNTLVLSDVAYRYRPGDRPALTGIDLVLAEGQRVAVLGPSGSGKSTLAALILRFRDPDAGSITLGGTDLRALPQAEIWRRVAYLSQRSQIFAGTIRDNLLIGAPEADDATLAAAVEAAGLAGWVATLPRGLDTWVGEAGIQASGGQARRIALARCILKDAPILVLDEPTEGLDGETEDQIIDALDRLTAGRTTLVITHRPALLRLAESAVLMAEGRIAVQGVPADVLDAALPVRAKRHVAV
ncbi:ATP-binding cassette subfamily C protein CydC [Inquilinus ginsengisoli]|uniref:ATP-binding cassette subfamily C protein CydC n=1 Tax=Inquilinus ginsengisoli TaxID=363840 RepID=A0ABU1JRE9_9PROT|nr:thiol reductant ABC exporter subunit CydC [Inquilinus ginsengisoli]MDR6291189.1 ATP-binding cassette subfamily C protein CydC [Inquilinus ginsengisoli]